MARLLPRDSTASQAEIEQRAREHFERLGCPAGRDLDHWLLAEQDYLRAIRDFQTEGAVGVKPAAE